MFGVVKEGKEKRRTGTAAQAEKLSLRRTGIMVLIFAVLIVLAVRLNSIEKKELTVHGEQPTPPLIF